jgi:hypothetical protein
MLNFLCYLSGKPEILKDAQNATGRNVLDQKSMFAR